jgi:hypothetical protein
MQIAMITSALPVILALRPPALLLVILSVAKDLRLLLALFAPERMSPKPRIL